LPVRLQSPAGPNRRFNGLGKIVPGPDFHIPRHLLLAEAIDQIVGQASSKPLASPSAVADEYSCHVDVSRVIEKVCEAVSYRQWAFSQRFSADFLRPTGGQ
jgi:hypothetical protein